MTVRELIQLLLDTPMDKAVFLEIPERFIDDNGQECSGYLFNIDNVVDGKIVSITFTDWRNKDNIGKESED